MKKKRDSKQIFLNIILKRNNFSLFNFLTHLIQNSKNLIENPKHLIDQFYKIKKENKILKIKKFEQTISSLSITNVKIKDPVQNQVAQKIVLVKVLHDQNGTCCVSIHKGVSTEKGSK